MHLFPKGHIALMRDHKSGSPARPPAHTHTQPTCRYHQPIAIPKTSTNTTDKKKRSHIERTQIFQKKKKKSVGSPSTSSPSPGLGVPCPSKLIFGVSANRRGPAERPHSTRKRYARPCEQPHGQPSTRCGRHTTSSAIIPCPRQSVFLWPVPVCVHTGVARPSPRHQQPGQQ